MTFLFRVAASRRGGLAPAPRMPRQPRDPQLGRGIFRRLSVADVVVGLFVLVLLYLVVVVGRDTAVSFNPAEVTPVDTSPSLLPYDAARSLLRMFLALAASYLFTFGYAYIAAHSRRAERLMIPALDILQSVPVLGFLAITTAGFIALFPGSSLGLEVAAIFAIFTSQVWNLTFSFYDSLITQPPELDEACRLMGLSRWRRFWRFDLPHGALGLIWNGMMSMGGGWFFLVVSETVSLANHDYPLPGIGSYAGAAIAAGDLGRVGLAVATMVIMVLAVNVLFWSPLVAWSEKFKNEQTEPDEVPRSLVLNLLRRSRWPRMMGAIRRRLAEPVNRWGDRILGVPTASRAATGNRSWRPVVTWTLTCAVLGYGTWRLFAYIIADQGWGVFLAPLYQGLFTLARVAVLMVVASLIWVPIGVWIGTNHRAARLAQPVVQLLASFPANFLFPFVTWMLLRTGVSLDIGGILLMALGAQWYILFNAIAGAQAIPTDLAQVTDDLGIRGGLRWRRLVLPAILPYYITGAITASGGAWNASIVAEIVTYGGTTLRATGLGAYIADAAESGDYHLILAGISVMALYVVAINRLVWRPLQLLVEAHYT